MGDSEALFLRDWFHHHMLWFWRPRKERTWRYTVRLAARAWCFMNGLGLRPRSGETQEEADRKRDFRTYRYGDARGCPEQPQGLRIGYKRGPAIKFLNPTPTRRKHLLLGWLPEFQHVPGPPRKAKRVRRVRPESEDLYRATPRVDARTSLSSGQALPGSLFKNSEIPAFVGMTLWKGVSNPAAPSLEKLPLPPEGGIKNLVRTKLECAGESMTCQDFNNPWIGVAIAPPGGGLQAGFECSFEGRGQSGQDRDAGLDGRSPPLASCEVTFGEEESCMLTELDDDWDAWQASHALIELQWSEWRQAVDPTHVKAGASSPAR